MSAVPLNSSLFSPGQQPAPPDDDQYLPYAVHQQGPQPYQPYVEPPVSHPSHPTASTSIVVSAEHSREKRCQGESHGGSSIIHNDLEAVLSTIALHPGTLFRHSFRRLSQGILPDTLRFLPANPLVVSPSHRHPPLRSVRIDRCLAEALDACSLTGEYPMEITPRECFSKIGALLCCPSRVTAARSLRGNEAQEFVDLLDQVSELQESRALVIDRVSQTLAQSYLDDKLRHRSWLLLSKICRARAIVPSSYKLQSEFIRVGRVYCQGGFADVSDGVYRGSPVAIKHLRISVEESDGASKVCLSILPHLHSSAFPRNCVGKSSHGNICPTRTFCLCWAFPSPRILTISAFSRSGCPTGTLCTTQSRTQKQIACGW